MAPTINILSYNWSTDRDGEPIVGIVAHSTVGTDSRDYLRRGGDAADGSDRKVSIHTLIRKDGVIYRYVPDERGANHAGYATLPAPYATKPPNKCTLSMELENASDPARGIVDTYTPAQLLSAGWQISQWRAKYGPLPIWRHGDIDPTRRKDPVGLTVAQLESNVQQYMVSTAPDPWAGWGQAYGLSPVQRSWKIPQVWLRNTWLGAARSFEMYTADGARSIQFFQNGWIVYEKAIDWAMAYHASKAVA